MTISNAIVGAMRDYTGRAATKARTTLRDNLVVVSLEQTLTKGEEVLVEKERGENVSALRREYQEAVRGEASAKVEEITGRKDVRRALAQHATGRESLAVAFADAAASDHTAISDAQGPVPLDEFTVPEIVELLIWISFEYAGQLFGCLIGDEPATEPEKHAFAASIAKLAHGNVGST